MKISFFIATTVALGLASSGSVMADTSVKYKKAKNNQLWYKQSNKKVKKIKTVKKPGHYARIVERNCVDNDFRVRGSMGEMRVHIAKINGQLFTLQRCRSAFRNNNATFRYVPVRQQGNRVRANTYNH